jgi:hypothetical protein
MDAERILKLIERAREPLLKIAHIQEYARIQIEKDRENIKEAIFAIEYEKYLIDCLPIELD